MPGLLITKPDSVKQLFTVTPSTISGCVELRPQVREDRRGRFVKVFHRHMFELLGLCADYEEEYYSVSRRGVIRGLHFQVPPMDHDKLIYCVSGRIQDAAVDLRCGSPTYGRYALFDVSAEEGNMVYVPRGLAHGFCTLSESAIVVYKVSSVYSAEHDRGLLWNSAGIPWAIGDPLVSDRDLTHPPFESFRSPFSYGAGS
ncbi:dTDP-4-dehydrorhamnose 3,5-epimerase [Candidatus Nitrospira inopinata]|jgi:dTDP-4-dehydrorhamnose 3,5-epimerase|uniref:dTDP-4-dehydrorhamnose 3,5-epimerase n=1 Tax=Candidatus Nitrospira inopinata TaxID=1715989 RepID=A0A0S4KXM3_9BACT|nr:dTDP-4-dehydrorhamnose 3,5-epimerase [Candidatus Nitrospira inopinata]CUQ67227.1 dTDP-4-dehydrorhamnose 3,5-epimerase [Candidatus Nitrospira inopinata]